MKKLLAAIVLGALPSAAFAGVGATAHLGAMNDGTTWAPTIDYRAKGLLIQADLLTFVGNIGANNEDKVGDDLYLHDKLDLGLAASYAVLKKKCMEDVEGVWMPGLEFRYVGFIGDTGEALGDAEFQSGAVNVSIKSRMGMEMKKGAGFGVYVVPKMGISTVNTIGLIPDEEVTLNFTYGGGIEVSAWFNK